MKDVKKYFDRADKDGDGEISREDWFTALTKAGVEITKEDVDEMFATHDKDRDGMLSWAEFSGEETKNEKAFKLMDADHNGKITKTEFKKFCGNLSMDQVNAAFKAFDISGDDMLDYEEFCKLMNNRDKKAKAKREKERKKKDDEKRAKQQKEKRRRRSSLDEDDAKEA